MDRHIALESLIGLREVHYLFPFSGELTPQGPEILFFVLVCEFTFSLGTSTSVL